MSTLHIIDHPLIQHKLTIMRKTNTSSKDFRQLLDEISMLMGYEVTRDLPLEEVDSKSCEWCEWQGNPLPRRRIDECPRASPRKPWS